VAPPGEQNLDPDEEEKSARAEIISPPGPVCREDPRACLPISPALLLHVVMIRGNRRIPLL
ncbi:hypothetical protein, partial [Klebsiella pneumoniae]|uniref:hypothetical protein n=1 Tax=Klebsiella pneumoniae TaxID=573 RepID=UPI00272FE30E